jgi:hypothetical protein
VFNGIDDLHHPPFLAADGTLTARKGKKFRFRAGLTAL